MDGNNRFSRDSWIGGALLLLSLIIAAAGVIISLRTGSSRYFLFASFPTAVLIVAGGAMIRKDYLGSGGRLLLAGGERSQDEALSRYSASGQVPR